MPFLLFPHIHVHSTRKDYLVANMYEKCMSILSGLAAKECASSFPNSQSSRDIHWKPDSARIRVCHCINADYTSFTYEGTN